MAASVFSFLAIFAWFKIEGGKKKEGGGRKVEGGGKKKGGWRYKNGGGRKEEWRGRN